MIMNTDWTQRRCQDCGLRLDPFGVCIMADPKDAAKMAAPVSCGLTPAMARSFLDALTAEFIKPEQAN